jgi:actin-related protein 10
MSNIETTSERPAVVLDIGTSYTKCGFANEPSPICIIKSEIVKDDKAVNIFQSRESLKENLIEFLYRIYYKVLNINARERRIIIVESILSPIYYRKLLAEILFKTFQVLSVTFLPTHLAALFALGSLKVLDRFESILLR